MLTQSPYFLDMSKEKDESEIAREDCPRNCAAAYPGKFGRNNRGGSVLVLVFLGVVIASNLSFCHFVLLLLLLSPPADC